jgi:hypothetical protein
MFESSKFLNVALLNEDAIQESNEIVVSCLQPFKVYHNLHILILDYCQISNLDDGVFTGLDQLQTLSLTGNNEHYIPLLNLKLHTDRHMLILLLYNIV